MKEEEILKKYKLTEEEHNEFYNTIKRIYVGGKTPQKNPISVIVGGQTGAGKSGILGYSSKMFEDDNVIIINSDEIKPFHPQSEEIARLYHNEEEAEQAEEHFKTAFQKQEAPEDIEEIKFENNILDTLLKTKKCASKAELKRLFEQGGIKVEGEKVTDYQSLNNFEGEIIIQMGKGSFFKIVK